MKTKKIISVILATVMMFNIFAVLCVNASAATLYPTGALADNWDAIPDDGNSGCPNISLLPSSTDLTSNFPTPGSQSGESCVGWAVGYALMSNLEYKQRGWTKNTAAHLFNPHFIYNQLNKGADNGCQITDALKLVVSKGACPTSYYPLNNTSYTAQPTALQKEAAKLYRPLMVIKNLSIYDMKYVLSQGMGVILGVNVYSDFDNLNASNPIYDVATGTSRGLHAICLIGYDNAKNAFKFINSWGTSWGVNGYGWISYDLVNSSKVNMYGAGRGFTLVKNIVDNYVMGDVDNNGKVESADARLALRFSAKLESLTEKQQVLADVDGNGTTNSADARTILRFSSKEISKFPIYE